MIEEAGGANREEVPPFDIVITGCGVWDAATMLPQGYYAADGTFKERPPSRVHTSPDSKSNCKKEKGGGSVVDKGVKHIVETTAGTTGVTAKVETTHERNKKKGKIDQNQKEFRELQEGFKSLDITSSDTHHSDGNNNNNNDDDDDDDDDFFGDQDGGDSELTAERKTQKSVSNKLYNDGYRSGKVKEEERLVQMGFDTGLKEGIGVGLVVGSFIAKIRQLERSLSSRGSDARSQDGLMIEYLSGKFIEDYRHNKAEAKKLLADAWDSCFPIDDEDNDHNDDNIIKKEMKRLFEDFQGKL